MNRFIWLLLLLCATSVSAQIIVGPGDTLKFPVILNDSLGNPVAVDSAADSILVRVIKLTAANAGGKDTCYLHRGLLDASTNSSLHTSGTASNTTFGGRAIQSFNFFASAYTLTNSATTSGPYMAIVMAWDATTGNNWTTTRYPFNYVYEGASTLTFANYFDSLYTITRWLAKSIMPDSTSGGLLSTSATLAAGEYTKVKDTTWKVAFANVTGSYADSLRMASTRAQNCLDSLQAQDNWIGKEASIQIVRDSLTAYKVRWDSLMAFAADANTQVKNRLLRIRDTVDNILDTLQLHDNWVAKESSVQIVRDSLTAYKVRWDSLLAFASDANTQVKNRILRLRDSVDAVLDTLQNAGSDLRASGGSTPAQIGAYLKGDTLYSDTSFSKLISKHSDSGAAVTVALPDSVSHMVTTLDLVRDSIHTVSAKQDSTWWASGNGPNAWYRQRRHTTVDTAFFGRITATDTLTLWIKVYRHDRVGAVPGTWADTVYTKVAP